MTYKEFTIKKKSGGVRKIVAPSAKLKSYQSSVKNRLISQFFYLYKKFPLVKDVFHGFIPNRNCVTAASMHIGYETTVMLDISNFFDNITIESVNKYLPFSDERMRPLFHKEGYAAQGFPSSPIICNIALMPIISDLVKGLKEYFDDFAITVYADDIAISINSTDKVHIKQAINLVILHLSKYNLKLNHSKTRVRFAKYGYRKILGINVGNDSIFPTRKTIRKLRAVKHNVKFEKSKPQSLGGLTTWSKCKYPNKYIPKISI